MKKLLIVLCGLGLVCVGVFFVTNRMSENGKEEVVNYGELYQVGDLPLTTSEVPLTYQLVEDNGKKVLNVSYKNNSEETIMTMSVNLELEADKDPVNVKFLQTLNSGETANVVSIEVADTVTVEDIKPVKYMISLQRGVYMEYDAKTSQYNWS